mgnify:CR=1 FL=1
MLNLLAADAKDVDALLTIMYPDSISMASASDMSLPRKVGYLLIAVVIHNYLSGFQISMVFPNAIIICACKRVRHPAKIPRTVFEDKDASMTKALRKISIDSKSIRLPAVRKENIRPVKKDMKRIGKIT